jgi:acyl carrier protein
MLEEFVQAQVAFVLGRPAHAVPREQGFANLGIDSLGAHELRLRLLEALDCQLAPTIAFDYPTVQMLSGQLLNEVLLIADVDARPPERNKGHGDLEDLSHGEIVALLAKELSEQEDGNKP